jgi:hypothetical protein
MENFNKKLDKWEKQTNDMINSGGQSCITTAAPLPPCRFANFCYQLRGKKNIHSVFSDVIAEYNIKEDAITHFENFDNKEYKYISVIERSSGDADGYSHGGNGYSVLISKYINTN